jgi:membrane dipeptidase
MMKRLGTALLLAALSMTPAQAQDDPGTVARRVLSTAPLVDGHNDLPWAIRESEDSPHDVRAYDLRHTTLGHTDIQRLRDGMVGAQFWSVYIPMAAVEEGAARVQLEQIDIAKQVFARYPDVFREATSTSAVRAAWGDGKIASIIGMEGGHAIENSLGALRAYYELGARYMTLTHSGNNDWADSATDDPEHDGLTAFGEEVIREMNRLGMLVDLSHTSPSTMHDVLNIAEAPVIFSHSSARGVTDHPRNVPDEVLLRLAENGGVVMITFVPSFISTEVREWGQLSPDEQAGRPTPRATIDDVIRHIEHVRDLAGIDHVGIGADFDGISSVPVGLEDVSTFPALFTELARRGWSEGDMRKLAGENVMRAWREAEEASSRIQRERGPSTRTIEEMDKLRVSN